MQHIYNHWELCHPNFVPLAGPEHWYPGSQPLARNRFSVHFVSLCLFRFPASGKQYFFQQEVWKSWLWWYIGCFDTGTSSGKENYPCLLQDGDDNGKDKVLYMYRFSCKNSWEESYYDPEILKNTVILRTSSPKYIFSWLSLRPISIQLDSLELHNKAIWTKLFLYNIRNHNRSFSLRQLRNRVCEEWQPYALTKSIKSLRFFSICWGGSRLIKSNAQSSCLSVWKRKITNKTVENVSSRMFWSKA